MILRFAVLAGLGLLIATAVLILRRYFGSASYPARFDVTDVGGADRAGLLVEFVSPYCYECKEALPLLKAASKIYGTPLKVVDARTSPELLSKYAIRHTPTILVVDRKGTVRNGWIGVPPEDELEAALIRAAA